MRFLCDVHISFKVVNFLKSSGYEAIHVNSILNGCYTKDKEISEYANLNDLIIITKDADFRDTYYVKKVPKKLIKINLGNISNSDLIRILSSILLDSAKLEKLSYFLIEIDKDTITYITEDNFKL